MNERKIDVNYRTIKGREARAAALTLLVKTELDKNRTANAAKMSKLRAQRLAKEVNEIDPLLE